MSGANFARQVLGRCVLRLDSGVSASPSHGSSEAPFAHERAAYDDRLLQVLPLLEVLLDELEGNGHTFSSPRAPHFHNRCVAYEFAPLIERVHLELLAEPPLDPATGDQLIARVGAALAKTVPRVVSRLPPPPQPAPKPVNRPWWRVW